MLQDVHCCAICQWAMQLPVSVKPGVLTYIPTCFLQHLDAFLKGQSKVGRLVLEGLKGELLPYGGQVLACTAVVRLRRACPFCQQTHLTSMISSGLRLTQKAYLA